MKKIERLIRKRERLLAKIDKVSEDLKLLHIEFEYIRELEFEYIRELHDLKIKKLN